MDSITSILKKIFSGISSAVKWLTQDDPRLREAKARSLGQPDKTESTGDTIEDIKEYPDPWEEIDNVRLTMWLGRWGSQYTKRSIDKLKQDLKRDIEKELERGKDKQE
jgi:hypothetical protein